MAPHCAAFCVRLPHVVNGEFRCNFPDAAIAAFNRAPQTWVTFTEGCVNVQKCIPSLSEVRILFVIVPFQGHQSVRQLTHCIYTVKRPYHHING